MTLRPALLMIAAVTFAGPALAADPLTVRPDVRTVHYADLDLGSSAGLAVLERRVARAVSAICAVPQGLQGLAVEQEQARCISETSASSRDLVNAAVRASRQRQVLTAGL
jgi:UrcA family protein